VRRPSCIVLLVVCQYLFLLSASRKRRLFSGLVFFFAYHHDLILKCSVRGIGAGEWWVSRVRVSVDVDREVGYREVRCKRRWMCIVVG
jgi:hypothetical protein